MGAVLPKLAALLRLEKGESGFIEGGGSRKKIRHIAFVGDDLQLMHGSLEVAAEWKRIFAFRGVAGVLGDSVGQLVRLPDEMQADAWVWEISRQDRGLGSGD